MVALGERRVLQLKNKRLWRHGLYLISLKLFPSVKWKLRNYTIYFKIKYMISSLCLIHQNNYRHYFHVNQIKQIQTKRSGSRIVPIHEHDEVYELSRLLIHWKLMITISGFFSFWQKHSRSPHHNQGAHITFKESTCSFDS